MANSNQTPGATPNLWQVVGGTAGLKVLVMGIGGFIGLVNSKIIVANFGIDVYAQYGLLAGLMTMIPFASLGMSAVVLNAVSESPDPKTDPEMYQKLTTSLRYLLGSGISIITISLAITLLNWWPNILGQALLPGASWAVFGCLSAFGLLLPLTIFPRMLIALGRARTQVLTQAIVAPLMMAAILLTIGLALPLGNYLAVYTYFANSSSALLCAILSARLLGDGFRKMLKDVFRWSAVPNAAILGLAWPQLVQTIFVPLATQTDRVMLSWFSTTEQLAHYNATAQLFQLVVQTINSAGIVLWPVFAKARAQGEIRSPLKSVAVFGAVGLTAGLALAAVTPWIVGFILKDAPGTAAGKPINLSLWLILGFAAYAAIQAANYPLSMYMSDERGLKFQVWPTMLMVPINLVLSWFFIPLMGAGGPVVSSVLAILGIQSIPYLGYVRRDLARRTAELATPGVPDESASSETETNETGADKPPAAS